MRTFCAMQDAAGKVLDRQAVCTPDGRLPGPHRGLWPLPVAAPSGRAFAPHRGMPRKRTPKNEELAFYEFETVLPSQFFGPQRMTALQPEKRLMLAVFEDAVLVYLRGM